MKNLGRGCLAPRRHGRSRQSAHPRTGRAGPAARRTRMKTRPYAHPPRGRAAGRLRRKGRVRPDGTLQLCSRKVTRTGCAGKGACGRMARPGPARTGGGCGRRAGQDPRGGGDRRSGAMLARPARAERRAGIRSAGPAAHCAGRGRCGARIRGRGAASGAPRHGRRQEAAPRAARVRPPLLPGTREPANARLHARTASRRTCTPRPANQEL